MSIAHEQLRALIEQALDLETTEERELLLAACLDPELAEEARVLLGLQTQAVRLDQGAARLMSSIWGTSNGSNARGESMQTVSSRRSFGKTLQKTP